MRRHEGGTSKQYVRRTIDVICGGVRIAVHSLTIELVSHAAGIWVCAVSHWTTREDLVLTAIPYLVAVMNDREPPLEDDAPTDVEGKACSIKLLMLAVFMS